MAKITGEPNYTPSESGTNISNRQRKLNTIIEREANSTPPEPIKAVTAETTSKPDNLKTYIENSRAQKAAEKAAERAEERAEQKRIDDENYKAKLGYTHTAYIQYYSDEQTSVTLTDGSTQTTSLKRINIPLIQEVTSTRGCNVITKTTVSNMPVSQYGSMISPTATFKLYFTNMILVENGIKSEEISAREALDLIEDLFNKHTRFSLRGPNRTMSYMNNMVINNISYNASADSRYVDIVTITCTIVNVVKLTYEQGLLYSSKSSDSNNGYADANASNNTNAKVKTHSGIMPQYDDNSGYLDEIMNDLSKSQFGSWLAPYSHSLSKMLNTNIGAGTLTYDDELFRNITADGSSYGFITTYNEARNGEIYSPTAIASAITAGETGTYVDIFPIESAVSDPDNPNKVYKSNAYLKQTISINDNPEIKGSSISVRETLDDSGKYYVRRETIKNASHDELFNIKMTYPAIFKGCVTDDDIKDELLKQMSREDIDARDSSKTFNKNTNPGISLKFDDKGKLLIKDFATGSTIKIEAVDDKGVITTSLGEVSITDEDFLFANQVIPTFTSSGEEVDVVNANIRVSYNEKTGAPYMLISGDNMRSAVDIDSDNKLISGNNGYK